MRRLALAIALCACALVMAAPAAAAPIDPGRTAHAAAPATQAHSSVLSATAYAYDRTVVLAASPSAVGDRPADGAGSVQHGTLIDLVNAASFNLATIGARQLLQPAAAISP